MKNHENMMKRESLPSEANCGRATDRGEEAWSVNREPMDKNRIGGGGNRGEWANDHEAGVTKGAPRRSGGGAVKVGVLTWGDLA